MNFGSTPSSSAIAWPRSTSKPSTASVCGFLNPNGGTSNFTPIVISPASCSSAIVDPCGELLRLGRHRPSVQARPHRTRPRPARTPRRAPPATGGSTVRVPSFLPSGPPSARAAPPPLSPYYCFLSGRRILSTKSLALWLFAPLKNAVRFTLLHGLPLVDERDPVAHLASEPHLVRHDDHRHAVVREIPHHVEHLADHLGVERRRRLVEEDQLRLHRERTGDRDPLLLAAREVGREVIGLLRDADALQEAARQVRSRPAGTCPSP